MRIIGGVHKGRMIKVPPGLIVRPTTDFAKEGLFNILNNRMSFEEASVLDLFSGTGHISLEFASRGSLQVTAVDENYKCVQFLKSAARELDLPVQVVKSDVFDFLKKSNSPFDLIFADPPYLLPTISEIHRLIFEKQLLRPEGILIIEHGPKTQLQALEGFTQHRKYGNVNFSFFEVV